jgi:hypothetical protein
MASSPDPGGFSLGAEDFLARGGKLLNENKPDQALVFLQAGLETGLPIKNSITISLYPIRVWDRTRQPWMP